MELNLLGCTGRGVGGFSSEFGGAVCDSFVGGVYVVQEDFLRLMARGRYSTREASARSSGRSIKGVSAEEIDKEFGDSLPFEEDIDAVPAERTAVLK